MKLLILSLFVALALAESDHHLSYSGYSPLANYGLYGNAYSGLYPSTLSRTVYGNVAYGALPAYGLYGYNGLGLYGRVKRDAEADSDSDSYVLPSVYGGYGTYRSALSPYSTTYGTTYGLYNPYNVAINQYSYRVNPYGLSTFQLGRKKREAEGYGVYSYPAGVYQKIKPYSNFYGVHPGVYSYANKPVTATPTGFVQTPLPGQVINRNPLTGKFQTASYSLHY